MKFDLTKTFNNNYRNLFIILLLITIFLVSIQQSYLLFHTLIELFSITVAFAVFIITWNSRKILDNNYLFLVGISYLFIGTLDLMHTITFTGMNVIESPIFFANQFWVATRFLESITLLIGFWFLKKSKHLNADWVFLSYLFISILIILSILYWKIFPACYIEGLGQTDFKIYSEYTIILILFIAGYFLIKRKQYFEPSVYSLLATSLSFAIISEFCFTLYFYNDSLANQIGHYAKLVSFYMIYKANVETGFLKPTGIIFKDLKDNEKKYRTLAENLPELILRLDKNFNCIYANNAIKQFTTEPNWSYEGKKYCDLKLPQSFDSVLFENLNLAKESKKTQFLNFDLNLRGIQYYLSAQIVPEYESETEIETYLLICFDITSLKNAEKNLQELNATKDKFFSIIAHDLRNPFNSLLGFSQLIYKSAGKYSPEKIQQLAMRMSDAAKQAFDLLENLLDWSKIQTGKLTPKKQRLDVKALIIEAKQLCLPVADAKGITIEIACAATQEINADRQMLNTVLRNIIINAIKFSYPNEKIIIACEDQDNFICVSITDFGMGIEEKYVNQILNIDSNYSKPGTTDEKGTGLGLILCKEFIELSGGKIWIESEFGKGTTFYFTVPAAPKPN